MKTLTVADPVATIDMEQFEVNKDRLKSIVEEDYRILAWIAWGLGLLFKEKSYKQMREKLSKMSVDDIKKFIKPVEVILDIEDKVEFVLNNNFKIFDESGNLTNLMNIKSPLTEDSKDEMEAQGLLYMCSLIWWQVEKDTADKMHYYDIVPVTSLWILPKVRAIAENLFRIYSQRLPGKGTKTELGRNGVVTHEIEPEFTINLTLIQCFLGDPFEFGNEDIFNKPMESDFEKADKEAVLNLLLDLVFGFSVDKEKRLQLLDEMFDLRGALTNEEVEIMNGYAEMIQEIFDQGLSTGEKQNEKQIINNITENLINESRGELTLEEARKRAEELAAPPIPNI